MNNAVTLSTRDLTIGYHNGASTHVVLKDINVSLHRGELVSILGANGTGKSTLLRTISGIQPPLSGKVMLEGRPIDDYTARELSRKVGIVYADRTMAGGLTVEELVALGRQPYTGFFGRLSKLDRRKVSEALAATGIGHKAGAYVSALSDGERQKVMMARVLAQETPVIFLDEPTAFLDAASRIEAMQMLSQLAHRHGKSVLVSSHDIGLSLRLSDRLWLLRDQTMIEGTVDGLTVAGEMERLFPGRGIAFDREIKDFRPL